MASAACEVQPEPRITVSPALLRTISVLESGERLRTSRSVSVSVLSPDPVRLISSMPEMRLFATAVRSSESPEPSNLSVSNPVPPSILRNRKSVTAIVSSPWPPRRTSAPPFPSSRSFPRPPIMTFAEAFPVSVSPVEVPGCVTAAEKSPPNRR